MWLNKSLFEKVINNLFSNALPSALPAYISLTCQQGGACSQWSCRMQELRSCMKSSFLTKQQHIYFKSMKLFLGWLWLGIKLTFELSGGTEKMCFLHPAHLQTAQWSFHFRLFPAAGICYIAHLSYHSKIPELDVLSINTVLSMNHPQGVTLHSSRSLLTACVLAPLHTECQTWWHGKHFLHSFCFEWGEMETQLSMHVRPKTMSVLLHRMLHLHCAEIFRKVRVDGRYLCRMHVKSGTQQAFSGSHTKLSAGQQAFFLRPLSHEPLLLGQSPLCVPMALG